MGIVNMVAGATKPVVLPHGTAHMSPASRMIHTLAVGAGRALFGGARRARKKKVSRRLRTKAPGRRLRRGLSSLGKRARGPKRSQHRRGRRHAARLVKGSRAAKLHMAKIRRMRGTMKAAA